MVDSLSFFVVPVRVIADYCVASMFTLVIDLLNRVECDCFLLKDCMDQLVRLLICLVGLIEFLLEVSEQPIGGVHLGGFNSRDVL